MCPTSLAAVSGRSFPDGFAWGTATAAHQVEGGNWNNDWWEWEHRSGTNCAEPSGDACDHFHRYPSDIAMLAGLGFGAYRFSVEWSRVEPEDGEFSRAALDHYRRMCEACRDHGIEPIVTFHHFTTPRWVAARGGWANPQTADLFARYCHRTAAHLGDLIGRACTINEPNIVATLGYGTGQFPPGQADPERRLAANDVFIAAHRVGADAIKQAAPHVRTGLTLSMRDYQAHDDGGDLVEQLRWPMQDVFLEAARGDDFVGIQTYTRERIGSEGPLAPEPGAELTAMGYEFWPEALAATLRRAWKLTDGVPVLITENGVAVEDDERRIAYVGRALDAVLGAIADGVAVEGYLYWSALDNFEWQHGYAPRFGLISVDRATQERTPKPSARWLGAIAAANELPAG